MNKRLYINIDTVCYRVKKFKKNKKLKEGIAYLINDKIVLPFYDHPVNKKKCGIYENESGEFVIVRPFRKSDYKIYSKDNIYSIHIDEMLKKTGVKSKKMDVILSESDDVFAPPITDEDNMLARIIKTVLIEKQINLKDYLPRFENQTDMSNFKKSLLSHPKMSFEKFCKWCDILDLEYSFSVVNSENAIRPINNEIIAKSNK